MHDIVHIVMSFISLSFSLSLSLSLSHPPHPHIYCMSMYMNVPYLLRLLECAVEGMRIDVVDRRCRVSEREVSELHDQVGSIEKTVKQLEGQSMSL